MPGDTPSQPGWYPDQGGSLRWYDGTAWTDHVQPGSAGGEPTQAYPGHPGAPTPTAPLPVQPAPGSAYGAVPQPTFPSYPAGPGAPTFPPSPGGGGNRGLLIALAVVGGIMLLAVLSVGAWAVFLRGDDGGSGNGGDNSAGDGLPDASPESVAEEFMVAVLANDCDAIEGLVTQRLLDEQDGCDDEDDPDQFSYDVGTAVTDEDARTATVPVSVTEDGPALTITLEMVVEDDTWLIDQFIEPDDRPSGSDLPTDLTDIPTDLLTDFPTDLLTDPSALESYFSDYLSDYFSDFSDLFTVSP